MDRLSRVLRVNKRGWCAKTARNIHLQGSFAMKNGKIRSISWERVVIAATLLWLVTAFVQTVLKG